MYTKIPVIVIPTILLLNSCSPKISKNEIENKPKESHNIEVVSANDIPYTIAKRYFVLNDYKTGELVNPRITSQVNFEKIFGRAPVSNKDGQPTSIDFSRQYVLAVITDATDHAAEIVLTSLKQNNNKILLTYKINEGEKRSITIQPLLLLIVDNQYTGDVELKRQ